MIDLDGMMFKLPLFLILHNGKILMEMVLEITNLVNNQMLV